MNQIVPDIRDRGGAPYAATAEKLKASRGGTRKKLSHWADLKRFYPGDLSRIRPT